MSSKTRRQDSIRFAVVSFGDSRFFDALLRLRIQCFFAAIFHKVWLWTPRQLDPEFRLAHSDFLKPSNRGYGYWIWKPKVILQALNRLDFGDVLLYIDAGCHVLPQRRADLMEFLKSCSKCESGIVCSQLPHVEKFWTKRYTIEKLGFSLGTVATESFQLQAGVLVITKTPGTVEFVSKWLKACEEDYGVIDDNHISEEVPGFCAHRHDQSVFSLLAKESGVDYISAQLMEQWREQKHLGPAPTFPIQARRDRGGPIRFFRVRLKRVARLLTSQS